MFIFLLPSLLLAGRIRPYGSRPLTMSNVNPGGWSEYNFTMMLETTLPSTGILEIVFPSANYPDYLGLGTTQYIYAPYPNLKIATFGSSAKIIQIPIGAWDVTQPLTVTIDGIINSPKQGGTGNFELRTKTDSTQSYIVDLGRNFAVIGLAQETKYLLDAEITIANNYAGVVTDYYAKFIPSQDISNVDYLIVFPDLYDLSYLKYCECSLIQNIQCSSNKYFLNYIYVTGNSGTIPKGTNITIILHNIINPQYQMNTPLFKFQILEKNTNNTLQQSEAVNGLYIQAGTMRLVKLIPIYQPFAGFIRDFQLQFRPTNPFQYARISTSFYQIMSCTITAGLLDISAYQDSICKPLGRTMYLSNFQSYVQSDYSYDYVEVTFTARIADPQMLTNPVEIYTYIDSEYIYLADKDTQSASSQIYVQNISTIHTSTILLTSSSTTYSASTTLTVKLNIDALIYNYPCLIALEIPTQYTGIPTCSYKDSAGGAYTSLSCTFASGFLNMTVPQITQSPNCLSTGCPMISITDIFNPQVGNQYSLRGFIIQSSTGTLLHEFNITQVIVTPQFTSTVVSQVTNQQNFQTAVDFTINIGFPIPAGVKNLADPFVSFSVIEIQFLQMNLGYSTFAYDLGSGLPDLSNLGCQFESVVAASGQTPSCYLIQGALAPIASSYALLKVQGYAAISPSGAISFKVPVLYPSTVNAIPRVTISLVQYNSKIRNVLMTSSYNIGSVKNQPGSPLLTFSGPTLQSLVLQGETSITYQFKTIFGIPTSNINGIYYQLPQSYTFNISQILISIDGNYIDSQYIQGFKNFIFIMFSQTFSNGVLHTLTIEKVDVPVSLPSGAITHYIYTTLNGQLANSVQYTMPSLTFGPFYDIQTIIDVTNTNHPFANYSIAFTTTMKSFSGSYILITFPAQYNLLTNPPYLDNTPTCNLQNVSSTTQIQYSIPTAQTFKISQFAPVISGQRITINIYGIQNPNAASTYSLQIQLKDVNNQVIEQNTKSVTITSTAFTPNSLTISKIDSIPDNSQALSIFKFTFTPNFVVPKLALIIITFPPADYAQLYSISQTLVNCRVYQSTIINLRQCNLDNVNSQVIIQTDLPISANNITYIEYYGLLTQQNPSSGITFQIKYNNIIIANSISVPAVVVSTPANWQYVVNLSFSPQNEAEIAYYNFQMQLNQFVILSSYTIFVRFPYQYDYIMGIEKLQVSSTSLDGALKMQLLHNHIIISGFYDNKNFTGTLDITLLGIINPNRLNNNPTDFFGFGLMNGNTIIAGNLSIPGIIPQLAPMGISLQSVACASQYSRYYSQYTFSFTPLQNILATANGGQLYIDFPNDFVIDHFNGACTATSTFSFFSSCQWDYFRFMFITNNQQWAAGKQLNLSITNVLTPDNKGQTKNFIIYNYDKTNKIVLGRSYSNLNDASLYFSYDGLQIDVNLLTPIILEVGSYSDPITINMTDIAQNTITLSPNVLNSTIIITPNPVQIVAGTKSVTFSIAAPRTILLKTFYIQWSKTGDTLPVTYAPLRLTQINMVKGTIIRTLKVETMAYMPNNGSSYPLYITTNNPPYQQLLITLSFYANHTRQQYYILDTTLQAMNMNYIEVIRSGMNVQAISIANLSTTQLSMQKLQYSVNYTVNTSSTYNFSSLTIYLTLTGYDADSFQLDLNQLVIPIVQQEFRNPKILDASAIKITRSSATFNVLGDIYGFIYYVYADQHMPDPTFQSTKFPINNQTLSYSNPKYGVNYIRVSSLDVNFTISDLIQGHDYEIFIFIMNLNRVSNPKFQKLYFQTLQSQKIALMTLKVDQTSIDSQVKLDYIQKMSDMITISSTRIIERTTSCQQESLDVSTSPSSYLYWNLMILPDPANMNDANSPLALAQTLNNRRTEIQQFITRLDSEPFFTVEEINENIPSFVVSPEMIDRTTSSISLRFSVSYCGKAYLIFRERPNSQNLSLINQTITANQMPSVQFPSAYQIKLGLNESNQPITSYSLTIMNTATFYQYNYTSLNVKILIYIFQKSNKLFMIFFCHQKIIGQLTKNYFQIVLFPDLQQKQLKQQVQLYNKNSSIKYIQFQLSQYNFYDYNYNFMIQKYKI